jgi:predicted amidophosphoribosyltransferase
VDDVITPGATSAAGAQALGEAGAGDVVALAYARTLGR